MKPGGHGAAAVETWQEWEAWRLVQPGGCICIGQVGVATFCRLSMWVRGAVPRQGQQQGRGGFGLTRLILVIHASNNCHFLELKAHPPLTLLGVRALKMPMYKDQE